MRNLVLLAVLAAAPLLALAQQKSGTMPNTGGTVYGWGGVAPDASELSASPPPPKHCGNTCTPATPLALTGGN